MPVSVPSVPGSTVRALTRIVCTPEAARPLRVTRWTSASLNQLLLSLVHSVMPASIAPPWVTGTSQRLCGPPGPLNEPRSRMSHGPEPTR